MKTTPPSTAIALTINPLPPIGELNLDEALFRPPFLVMGSIPVTVFGTLVNEVTRANDVPRVVVVVVVGAVVEETPVTLFAMLVGMTLPLVVREGVLVIEVVSEVMDEDVDVVLVVVTLVGFCALQIPSM